MEKLIPILLLLAAGINQAYAGINDHGLQLDVKREGHVYMINASFDTSLTKCSAYHFLTDYEGAREMPSVIELLAQRQANGKMVVKLTAAERILFFSVRLHSVMEYTEKPFSSVSFRQLSGNLKSFQGEWNIEPGRHGSKLVFSGFLERDTRLPLFIVDIFVKNSLDNKFHEIAELAEKHKNMPPATCGN